MMTNMQCNLTLLFKTYIEEQDFNILELEDIGHKPVGALYLEKLKYKDFTISETNNSERYFIYVDGVGIYFSFFKKIRRY